MIKCKFILATILICFTSDSLYSQTQSLWSEIRNSNTEAAGLSSLQYQVPLCLNEFSFFDINKLKGKNDAIYLHGWLVRDFNNDGFADIFLGFAAPPETESVPFMLLTYDKNTGTYKDQSFRIKNNLGQSWNRKSMAADFNGDGILDIVAVSHPECITCNLSYFDVLLSNPDTTWTQKRLKVVDRFKGEGYYHGVAVGDIDNDGDIDIVLGNENSNKDGIYSMINDGKGNFMETQAVPFKVGNNMTTFAWTVELADINKDGCLDLFYWDSNINKGILYGNCTDTFGQTYQDFGSLKYPFIMDYILRDLDGDGDLDLILNTTDYVTGWQLVVLENKGIDDNGKVIWVNHTDDITQSLKANGFYPDGDYGMFYLQAVDINNDGYLDIIPRAPLTNQGTCLTFGWRSWILLGDGAWKFKYKSIPFAEPPNKINSTFTSGNITLNWNRVLQNFSTSDGAISKWAIYISDKSWGDRSQVSKPIIVSSNDTKKDGFDFFSFKPISKDMFIRIAPIDSSGIEWPLSNIYKISIPPPTISSVTICDGKTLTIIGANFFVVKGITIGGSPIPSFKVLSETSILASIETGQTGNIVVSTTTGEVMFSDITYVVPSALNFVIKGNKSPLKGALETYSVPNAEGVTFNWTFPEGWQQVSGNNSNSVTLKVGPNDGEINLTPSAICGSLTQLTLPVSVYTYVPDDYFQKALHDLGIDKGNKKDSILTSSVIKISSLNVDLKNISDLTGIQDFESLKKLECRSNQVKALDLTKNKLLEEFYCVDNKLTSLDVSKNTELKMLDCNNNMISFLDVSQNKLLVHLVCNSNPITSLNLTNNKELALLSVYNQAINSIDITNNTKLTYFSCVNLRLTELDVSKNVNLGLVNCSGNQLISVDVSKNPALTYLGCADNKLVYLNMKNGNNKNLKTFYANNNPNLSCISVDDPVISLTYLDWKKDATAKYSDYCIPTRIELTELNKSIVVKPNPTIGIFFIEGLPTNQENLISVYTIDGRLIRKVISNTITQTIDLCDQVSGLYVLFINNQPFKIIKE